MGLIIVKNTNGRSLTLSLDKSLYLNEIREILIKKEIMLMTDSFIYNDSKVDVESEKDIKLEDYLEDNCIIVGKYNYFDDNVTFDDFMKMNEDIKMSYFDFHQLSRGLTIGVNGIERTSHDVMNLLKVPLITRKISNTNMQTSYSFSEINTKLHIMTSVSTSLSLNSEYGDANASYKQELESTTNSSSVNEYLLSKYIVEQASVELSEKYFEINMDFYNELKKIVSSSDKDHQKAAKIVQILNQWGYYIPTTFLMGGLLYTSDKRIVTSYSEAQSNKQNFEVAAKTAIMGIDIGTSISGGYIDESENSSKNEFKNLEVKQIGGDPGSYTVLDDFYDSLKDVNKWEIVDITGFYPTLLLLKNVKTKGGDNSIFRKVLRLLNENYYIDSVKTIQPYINIYDYITDIQERINPF